MKRMKEFFGLSDSGLVDALAAGGVGVIPTDTVYGVVCRADQEAPVARLYALKSREQKPGTVIAANVLQLVELGIPRRYLTAVEHFWPAPLSVILPTKPSLQYLDFGKSLAVRIPANQPVRNLLEKTGPLLTTSANLPGSEPANTIDKAKAYFNGKVDFYADGGDLSGRPPSTIIRIIDDEIDVIREGAVKVKDLEG